MRPPDEGLRAVMTLIGSQYDTIPRRRQRPMWVTAARPACQEWYMWGRGVHPGPVSQPRVDARNIR